MSHHQLSSLVIILNLFKIIKLRVIQKYNYFSSNARLFKSNFNRVAFLVILGFYSSLQHTASLQNSNSNLQNAVFNEQKLSRPYPRPLKP